MWEERATRFYFTNPSILSDDASVRWLLAILRFMFEFRQAGWDHLNWFHMGSKELSEEWDKRQRHREALNALYHSIWDQLLALCPPSLEKLNIPSILMWFEPALWYRPHRHCTWVPMTDRTAPPVDPPGESFFANQLPDLYREEPLRLQWAGAHHRFVEGLPNYLWDLVRGHHTGGVSWLLPRPWRDPDYRPLPENTHTLGSPGPAFYTSEWVFRLWNEEQRRVMDVLRKRGIRPEEVYDVLAFRNGFYTDTQLQAAISGVPGGSSAAPGTPGGSQI
jgi:hypothetical protein